MDSAPSIRERYDREAQEYERTCTDATQLAGGVFVDGLHLDSHNRCSPQEVFSLLSYVAPRCPVRGVNFEMDGDFPPFARLREELRMAREILLRCGAKGAGGTT